MPDTTGLYSATPVDGWGIAQETVPPAFPNYVDAVKVVGDAVYAVGSFAHAVHGPQSAVRANVMAVQASTGALLPFVADTNGPVYAVASDGSSLYIGGDFTTVNGVARNRIARLDLVTGAVNPTFKAGATGPVRDLLVVGSKLYMVGEFTKVNNTTRHHAAVVNTTNGGLDPNFDPNTSGLNGVGGTVYAVASSPDGSRMYIGGNFTTVGGVARQNLAEVNAVTGAAQGPTFAQVNDRVEDLSVRSDGTHVYAGTKFNSAVDWDTTTGTREWAVRADGDVQAVQYSDGYVYMGFHDGYLKNSALRLLALAPADGAVDPTYQPASNSYPGVYTLDADGHYLVAGGYFSTMGGVPVKGLAIFPHP